MVYRKFRARQMVNARNFQNHPQLNFSKTEKFVEKSQLVFKQRYMQSDGIAEKIGISICWKNNGPIVFVFGKNNFIIR